jgi:hypothetical protein
MSNWPSFEYFPATMSAVQIYDAMREYWTALDEIDRRCDLALWVQRMTAVIRGEATLEPRRVGTSPYGLNRAKRREALQRRGKR